jgi:hypothetical protein
MDLDGYFFVYIKIEWVLSIAFILFPALPVIRDMNDTDCL